MRHTPVLLTEVVDGLALQPGDHVIDGTVGDGGHSEAILERTGPNGTVLALDLDPESILRAKQHLYRFEGRITFVRDSFLNMDTAAVANNFQPVHKILLDLGWSTPQFKERGRGFSFEGNEPLDMRFAPDFSSPETITAEKIVNTYSAAELARIFRQYGEEKFGRDIAEAIVATRKSAPVATTKALNDIVLSVYRAKLKSTKEVPWVGGRHPSTLVFQALRIETNQELTVLEQALPRALALLAPGGRLAVISFHSLEDRIAKNFCRAAVFKGHAKFVNKKPIIASDAEVEINPSARSAKLRIIEKI